METFINTLIVLGTMIVIVGIIFLIIRAKINSVTRSYLGMNAGETTKFLAEGLKNEASLPKPITDLSAVYRPQIQRDFPELGYTGMAAMAQNALINAFNAEEKRDAGLLSDASKRLDEQVRNIIEDNISTQTLVKYDDVEIAKTGISRYVRTASTAEAVFEISLAYLYCKTRDGKVIDGNNEKTITAAYKVVLTYNQDDYLNTTSIVYSSACPNCGAPVSAVGDQKYCSYCSSGLTLIEDRLWQVNSYLRFK